MHDLDGLLGQLLDWMDQQAESDTETVVNTQPFMKEYGLGDRAAIELVMMGVDRGLLGDRRGLSDQSVLVTLAGVMDVQARRKRRTNPVFRAKAAQVALLRWLHEQFHAGVSLPFVAGVLKSDHALFEGDLLTEAEIDRAAVYLVSEHRQLIRGPGSRQYRRNPIRADITSLGIDCIDYIDQYGGSVSDCMRELRTSGPSININTLNNRGALAVGNQGDTTQHIGAEMDLAALSDFLRTLSRELPNLRLEPEREAVVRAELDAAQREMEENHPGAGQAVGILGRAVGYLVDAGKPVITNLFLLLAQHYATS